MNKTAFISCSRWTPGRRVGAVNIVNPDVDYEKGVVKVSLVFTLAGGTVPQRFSQTIPLVTEDWKDEMALAFKWLDDKNDVCDCRLNAYRTVCMEDTDEEAIQMKIGSGNYMLFDPSILPLVLEKNWMVYTNPNGVITAATMQHGIWFLFYEFVRSNLLTNNNSDFSQLYFANNDSLDLRTSNILRNSGEYCIRRILFEEDFLTPPKISRKSKQTNFLFNEGQDIFCGPRTPTQ